MQFLISCSGLVSAHILAELIRDRQPGKLQWYQGELLNMALEVGYRMLPAFNSTTGIVCSTSWV